MRIAFIALYDLNDLSRGSGTYYNIYRELVHQNHFVKVIGPLEIKFPFLSKLFRFITKRILHKRYRSYQDPFVGNTIGKVVVEQLSNIEYDILLTNDYAIAGYTKINKPIVLWTDAIFPFNYSENKHPWLEDIPAFAVKFCQVVIKKALKNVSLCIVPASWNYNEILKYNIINKDMLSLIPFGANITDPGDQLRIKKSLENKNINILFVGKDFKRKNLDCAIKVIQELQKVGVNAFLNIVGVEEELYWKINGNSVNDTEISECLEFHGLLDKQKHDQMEFLLKLYENCDVFLLPSTAEGFGIVYVEASAYGIPSLGYKTQGVTTAVKNGESGVLLDINKGPTDFANIILCWLKNPEEYKKLCIGARRHYENDGRWEKLIPRFINYVEDKLELQKSII